MFPCWYIYHIVTVFYGSISTLNHYHRFHYFGCFQKQILSQNTGRERRNRSVLLNDSFSVVVGLMTFKNSVAFLQNCFHSPALILEFLTNHVTGLDILSSKNWLNSFDYSCFNYIWLTIFFQPWDYCPWNCLKISNWHSGVKRFPQWCHDWLKLKQYKNIAVKNINTRLSSAVAVLQLLVKIISLSQC